MNQLKYFIELIRLKKPVGFMLLFWPCAWGLTLAYDFSNNLNMYYFYLFLFFSGSVLMRSAGCIVNDIFDREFDKKVFRTKDRPLASKKISVKLATIYIFTLCFFALIVLMNFNSLTIFLAICSMPLAFTYPLMKRFTYWPQLFLGITFNYGLILGWTSIKNQIDIIPIIFYMGAIFWTLGYDTIYGYQDIKDDEIIGLKSTSIKFKGKEKNFLYLCYLILTILFLIGGIYMEFNYLYFILAIIPFCHLFFFQMKIFRANDSLSCLRAFRSNNLFGLIIFLNFLISKNF